MTALATLQDEDRKLLVSLPYKVGMWVSYADDVDGEEDDALEEKALIGCIKAVARLHEDKPFVGEVAAETLRLQQNWPAWAGQAFHVPAELQKAMEFVNGNLPEEQAKNYKRMLMEIGSAVAQASGEFEAFDDIEDEESGFGAFLSKIVGGFSSEDKDHPMNVSASEDSALEELREILRKK